MKKNFFKIPVYIYFIIATLIILALFPRQGKFRYNFTEGRPWQYGLLTAPFDFPIYKTDFEIKQEEDTIIKKFVPYFKVNKDIVGKNISQFQNQFTYFSADLRKPEYRRYVERTLNEIYSKGIISVNDLQKLQNEEKMNIRLMQDSLTTLHPVKDLYTVKSAYDYLIRNTPTHLDENILQLMNLNDYLHENLQYDELTSSQVQRDILDKIAPSSGMIQAGEKIIDRGEIVTSDTYNILRSLKVIYEKKGGVVQRQAGLLAGVVILITILMGCLFFYFYYLRRNMYNRTKDILFILFILLLFTVLTELALSYQFFNIYIIPYAMIPLVIRTFFDSRTAQMTHLITILICALMLAMPFDFIIMQLIVCMITIYVLKDLTQRSQLIKCSFYILVSYLVIYACLLLYRDGDFSGISWPMLLYFAINFIFIMFTYPFIYILEKIFGYISNVTLVELSDINTPLLQMLSEKAPGTFQHSLQVSMLGTAAAVKVGANPQLVRTGALYHDIGKISNPVYYTENKMPGTDPHQHLSLEQSARIITSHVPEGEKLAEQYGIPDAIVKFVRTHHGKGKAKYFYYTFKNQNPDKEVNEEAFSYSGENPDTKETAILMMADSVEAASRSLSDYTPESIQGLVNKIVDGQIADGLLYNAPLTFHDISAIKNVFVEKLVSIYHSRITYPELNDKKESEEEEISD